ncbi:MAG: hypothetical protein JNK48_20580 [Bryobacterales bacterium]|nr:hypothetical protein [Bryobacterales bacterium]
MRWIATFLLVLSLRGQDGQNQQRPGWPCVAGRAVDPAYLELSESTGGQLFLFQKGEVEHASVVMMAPSSHPVTLYRAVGQLSGERTFEFPVDSSVESMLVMASVQCRQSVSVFDPSGPEVPGAKAARNIDLKAGRIVQIDKPSFGPWRLRLSGSGLFVFSVLVKSKITLHVSEEDEQFRIRTNGFRGSVTAYEFDAAGLKTEAAARYRIAVEGADDLGFKVLRTNPVLFKSKKRLSLQAASRAIVAW